MAARQMLITINASFAFEAASPTDALLQFEAAASDGQAVLASKTHLKGAETFNRVPAHDAIGERIWLQANGRIEATYSAEIEISREFANFERLSALPLHQLPGEAVQYLLESRYCAAEKFHDFADTEFAGTMGGARLSAIRDWMEQHLTYAPGTSGPYTDAGDTFIARQGVCRDYAHVLITLARASGIPARYVACYSPGVNPPDFHAVAEVFLADPRHEEHGKWHLVDGTGMASPRDIVKIGVGRDAADVSFLTSFGPSSFECSSVRVEQAA